MKTVNQGKYSFFCKKQSNTKALRENWFSWCGIDHVSHLLASCINWKLIGKSIFPKHTLHALEICKMGISS